MILRAGVDSGNLCLVSGNFPLVDSMKSRFYSSVLRES